MSTVFFSSFDPPSPKFDFVQFQLMPVFYVVKCRPLDLAQLSKFHLKCNVIARRYENFFLIGKRLWL